MKPHTKIGNKLTSMDGAYNSATFIQMTFDQVLVMAISLCLQDHIKKPN